MKEKFQAGHRSGYHTQMPTHSDPSLLYMLPVPKVPNTPKTVSTAEDQLFKHMTMGTFHIETTEITWDNSGIK